MVETLLALLLLVVELCAVLCGLFGWFEARLGTFGSTRAMFLLSAAGYLAVGVGLAGWLAWGGGGGRR